MEIQIESECCFPQKHPVAQKLCNEFTQISRITECDPVEIRFRYERHACIVGYYTECVYHTLRFRVHILATKLLYSQFYIGVPFVLYDLNVCTHTGITHSHMCTHCNLYHSIYFKKSMSLASSVNVF